MTPLLKITEKIYAKLETYQPTGSVKDRMVNYIVDDALVRGKILPGITHFIEATSGNTGISLASAAAKLGCKCTIVMPRNMSEQRKQMMKAFGADIIEVGDNDFQGAIVIREKLISDMNRQTNNSAWCPYQFENPLNIACHYETTAAEICDQAVDLGLDWEVFVHGSGTGGTMMGVKRFLNEYDIGVKCVLTVPAEDAASHGIQGINDGADFLLERSLMDEIIPVTTNHAIERMERFAKEYGILVGISSGANLVAAEEYVRCYDPEGIIITMLCDRGERYI